MVMVRQTVACVVNFVGGECQLSVFLILPVFVFGVHDKSQKSQDDDLKSETRRREDGLRQRNVKQKMQLRKEEREYTAHPSH